MIFNLPKLISYISAFITLELGDLKVTGTPGGNGPVRPEDLIQAGLKTKTASDITQNEFSVE